MENEGKDVQNALKMKENEEKCMEMKGVVLFFAGLP